PIKILKRLLAIIIHRPQNIPRTLLLPNTQQLAKHISILVPQLSRRVLIGRQTRRNNCHNTSTSTSPLDSLDSFDGLRPNFTAPKCAQVTAITGVKSTSNRSEEHTSELQSRFDLVCRLL